MVRRVGDGGKRVGERVGRRGGSEGGSEVFRLITGLGVTD